MNNAIKNLKSSTFTLGFAALAASAFANVPLNNLQGTGASPSTLWLIRQVCRGREARRTS